MTVYERLGAAVQGFGGLLRCTTCGTERPLGSVAGKLENGWPKHCGYTMRWITDRELKEENHEEHF